MKKLVSLLLILMLALSLVACANTDADSTSDPSVPTTTTPTTEPTTDPTTVPTTQPDPSAPAFDASAAADLIGSWTFDFTIDGGMFGEGFTQDLVFPMIATFDDQGVMTMAVDKEKADAAAAAFSDALRTYTIDLTYAEMEKEGLDKEAADAALKEAMGMDIPTYVDSVIGAIDFAALMTMTQSTSSYSVADGKLYTYDASAGDFAMEINSYKVEGDSLSLLDSNMPEGWEGMGMTFPIVMARVAE